MEDRNASVALLQTLNADLFALQQQLLGCKNKQQRKGLKRAIAELDATIGQMRHQVTQQTATTQQSAHSAPAHSAPAVLSGENTSSAGPHTPGQLRGIASLVQRATGRIDRIRCGMHSEPTEVATLCLGCLLTCAMCVSNCMCAGRVANHLQTIAGGYSAHLGPFLSHYN